MGSDMKLKVNVVSGFRKCIYNDLSSSFVQTFGKMKYKLRQVPGTSLIYRRNRSAVGRKRSGN